MSKRAFRDALRDILHAEGVFRMASFDEPDVIWEFDGERWVRARLSLLNLDVPRSIA